MLSPRTSLALLATDLAEGQAGAAAAEGRAGSAGHLLRLFPLLCECISIQEPNLRALLQTLFVEVSEQIGLR